MTEEIEEIENVTENLYEHGGDLVGKALNQQGIEYIFTLCGGHISPILIGAKKYEIDVIDVRDEVTSVFAADAISRITGNVGVATVTAGPGLTNAVTALKNAQMAGTPLVLFGGATATMLKGRGSLQDIDQISLVKSLVKWSTTIKSLNEIIPKLNRAFEESLSGNTGPVFVEFPLDILYPEKMVRDWYPSSDGKDDLSIIEKIRYWYIDRHVNNIFEGDPYNHDVTKQKLKRISPRQKDIEYVEEILKNSERPVMLIGSQIIKHVDSIDLVVQSLELLGIPVYFSSSARGLLGRKHKIKFRHKKSKVVREADTILLVGVPMDFRLDYGRKLNSRAKLIMVNREKNVMGMNNDFRSPLKKIHVEPSLFIIQLASVWEKNQSWDSWVKKIRKWNNEREEEIAETAEQSTDFINPLKLLFEIEEILPNNSILIGDGGDFVATMSYIVKPRGPLRWLDPGPFGTLGVGAGFALGAKLARPNSQIWIMYGDGSAGYSLNEFDTFVRHGIPVIAVIGNDAGWTQIRRDQEVIFDDPLATTLEYTNYEKVVEGYGAKGLLLEDENKIKETLEKAIKLHDEGHPVVINAKIGKTDFRKGSLSM